MKFILGLCHQANGAAPGGGNVQSMSSNLQRKFAKGCNYNMKVRTKNQIIVQFKMDNEGGDKR